MTGVKALPDLEGSGIFQGLLASRPLVMDRSRDAFWACVSKCSSEKCRPVRATRFAAVFVRVCRAQRGPVGGPSGVSYGNVTGSFGPGLVRGYVRGLSGLSVPGLFGLSGAARLCCRALPCPKPEALNPVSRKP